MKYSCNTVVCIILKCCNVVQGNVSQWSFYGGWGGTGGRVNCCRRQRGESITQLLAPPPSLASFFHPNHHGDHLKDDAEDEFEKEEMLIEMLKRLEV